MTERQRKPKKRILFLESEIQRHRELYYNEQPEISDAKYDSLEDELKKIDPGNPILFRIGVDRSELFNKERHIIPMNSQDNNFYLYESYKIIRQKLKKIITEQKFLKT